MAEPGSRRAVWTRESGGSNPPPLTNAGVAQLRQSARLQNVEWRFEAFRRCQIFSVAVVVVQRSERSVVARVMSVRLRSITPNKEGWLSLVEGSCLENSQAWQGLLGSNPRPSSTRGRALPTWVRSSSRASSCFARRRLGVQLSPDPPRGAVV
jgi:hypothetical protein